MNLTPCAQVTVAMSPDVGQSRIIGLEQRVDDRMIMNNQMNGGATTGGKAYILIEKGDKAPVSK